MYIARTSFKSKESLCLACEQALTGHTWKKANFTEHVPQMMFFSFVIVSHSVSCQLSCDEDVFHRASQKIHNQRDVEILTCNALYLSFDGDCALRRLLTY